MPILLIIKKKNYAYTINYHNYAYTKKIVAFIYLCRSPQSCPKTGIYGCSVRHTHRQKHCISQE